MTNLTRRTFRYNGTGDRPFLLVTEVSLYRNGSAARGALADRAAEYERKGATVNETAVSGGTTVTVVEVTTDGGSSGVIALARVDNALLTSQTFSTEGYYRDRTIRLVLEMAGRAGA